MAQFRSAMDNSPRVDVYIYVCMICGRKPLTLIRNDTSPRLMTWNTRQIATQQEELLRLLARELPTNDLGLPTEVGFEASHVSDLRKFDPDPILMRATSIPLQPHQTASPCGSIKHSAPTPRIYSLLCLYRPPAHHINRLIEMPHLL